jgi:hypothetical protein
MLEDQSRNYFYSFLFEIFWTPHLYLILVVFDGQILTSMEASNTTCDTNYIVLFRTIGNNEVAVERTLVDYDKLF